MMELVQVSTGNYKLVKLSSSSAKLSSSTAFTPIHTTTTAEQQLIKIDNSKQLTTSGKKISLESGVKKVSFMCSGDLNNEHWNEGNIC